MKLSLVGAVVAAVLSACGLASVAQAQVTRYVDGNPNDGYHPPKGEQSHATIQDAVNVALNGDTVLVFPGTYSIDESTPGLPPDQPVVDMLGKAITLQAFFVSPTSEAEKSIIDGGSTGTPARTRRGIRCRSGEGPQTSIVGLQIQNCSLPTSAGAGMLLDGASPVVRQCVFLSNSAGSIGGGIYALNSFGELDRCVFGAIPQTSVPSRRNEALAGGGAAISDGGFLVSQCVFADNRAQRGAGLSLVSDSTIVSQCQFIQNTSFGAASGAGAAAQDSRARFTGCGFNKNTGLGAGGGLAVFGTMADVRCLQCVFDTNAVTVNGFGGGLAVYGLTNSTDIFCTLIGCEFKENYADHYGGAIWTDGNPNIAMDQCLIQDNKARYEGGGLMVYFDRLPVRSTSITRCRFIRNQSEQRGAGAIWFYDAYATLRVDECQFDGNFARDYAGALYLRHAAQGVDRELTETVFTNNRAVTGSGGAIYIDGAQSKLRLGESHFCGNTPNAIFGETNLQTTQPNCFTTQCGSPLPIDYPAGIPGACESFVEDFDGLVTELKPILHDVTGLPTGAVCWRVYAGFDPGKQNASVLSMFGNSGNLLRIHSDGGFHQFETQDPDGQTEQYNTPVGMPCANQPVGFLYDSFVTIGAECAGQAGVVAQNLNFTSFNAATGACTLETSNGAVYVLPGDPGGRAGADLRTLLLQVTTKTPAKPDGLINLLGKNAAAGVDNEWFAYQLRIPDPSLVDCNENRVHDAIDLATGVANDCNLDGVPDSCPGQSPDLLLDCDEDGIPNVCEFRTGSASDNNGNGLPDDCECPGDADQNGVVDIDDILEVFIAWGDPNPGSADLDGSGTVDAKDLCLVIDNWNRTCTSP